ncbi:MAG: tetratricopeptide repeat protein [Planctomycetota bacterium]|jgi:tetratricopeptide (TPR) repeat protein
MKYASLSDNRFRRKLVCATAIPLIVLICLAASAGDRKIADLFYNAGMKAVEQGDTDKAIEQFEKALDSYGAHPDAVLQLGNIYSSRLDTTALIPLYEKWLKAFGELARPTEKQADVSQKLAASLLDFKELERIDKKFARKFLSLAKALKKKDEDAAGRACEKALQLDPGYTAAAREYKKLTGSESAKPSRSKKKEYTVGGLVFADDYSEKKIQWYLEENFCWYEKGKYIVKSDHVCPFTSRFSTFRPANFYMEVKMQLQSTPDDSSAAGFLFRFQSAASMMSCMYSADGKFGLWILHNGVKKDLTGKATGAGMNFKCGIPSKHIKKGKATNRIAMACVGSKLYFYANGKEVYRFEDSTLGPGLVGFTVNTGHHKYAWDDFRIHEATEADK